VAEVGAAQIRTIEGLGASHLHPIQRAWILAQPSQLRRISD
jgi:aerobic-type carbon monoxide dehydrogenase small subunit (CoxS/CutS family)